MQEILQKLFIQQTTVDFDLKEDTTVLLANYAFLPIKELIDFKLDATTEYEQILVELDTMNWLDPVVMALLKGIAGLQAGNLNAEIHLLEAQAQQITALGYSYLALGYFLQNQIEKAVQVYTDAIVSYPKEPYFYACRCVLNRILDDDEGAFYDYQIAKRLDFNYHSLLEWEEHLPYLVTLKSEQAEIEELEETWSQDTQDLDVLAKLALEFVDIYDYQHAVNLYTQGLSLAKDQSDWYVYRAAIYTKLTQYVAAQADCDLALAIDSGCVSAYVLRAKVQECLSRHTEALADYGKAESLNPEQSVIYEERASLFERIGKFEDAVIDYSKLISLMKDDFYPYVLRADVFERLGKQEEALMDYSKAIDLNPYYSDLYQYRAAIKESLGDILGAEADLRKFEELDED
ncbi:tetratricopeptide repeat protein [Sphingobacterium sp. ML3W]|uniref:tetratricopeptide repeat protein n=1 Tax=Sphingobacterium sp. ML3W TaxID=1538644 RepID=UPI00068B0AB6|nr:hypothetical protein [Sphingobacterium sp. ML3W]